MANGGTSGLSLRGTRGGGRPLTGGCWFVWARLPLPPASFHLPSPGDAWGSLPTLPPCRHYLLQVTVTPGSFWAWQGGEPPWTPRYLGRALGLHGNCRCRLCCSAASAAAAHLLLSGLCRSPAATLQLLSCSPQLQLPLRPTTSAAMPPLPLQPVLPLLL